MPAIVSAAATPVTDPPNVIVVLRPGASSADVAGRHSLRMGEQYQTIFNGFAATVNVQDFADDPDVVRVVPNRTFQLGTLHPHILSGSQMALPPGILPIDQAIDCDPSAPLAPSDQDVTISVRRVGILNSPTAKVDSCDERVDADIAILDTGIDPNHPDLNVAGGFNCTGPDRQAWADDSGHGTGVAGVAAAKDDHQGIVGVAPGARLWSIKVLDANGFGTFEDLLCGFEWVTRNSSRIDVANMSLAGPGADDGACGSIDGDVVHAAICRVVQERVTAVVSAGNDSVDASDTVPASYSEVITVSGLADTDGLPGGLGDSPQCSSDGFMGDDTVAAFSNFGSAIDVAAPSVCVTTDFPENQFAQWDGTSFAAPHVAGAAALLMAHNPFMSPDRVKARILTNAHPGPIPSDPDFPSTPSAWEGVLNVAGF